MFVFPCVCVCARIYIYTYIYIYIYKCCEYNNKDKENSLKILNDKKKLKGYSTFPRSSALEPHHQMKFSLIL